MTTLTINPSIDRKSAKCVGRVAAGEHVAVTISGMGACSSSSTMFLRVMFGARTIAQFPQPVEQGATQDSWGTGGTGGADLTCTLNLNTVEALKTCYGPQNECVVILEELGDSAGNQEPTLYFVAPITLFWWPQKREEEQPYDLGRYPGLIANWAAQIGRIAASVTRGQGSVVISITDKNGVTTTASVHDGAKGDPGPGVIAGGSEGQVLTKRSGTDFDTEWRDLVLAAPFKVRKGNFTYIVDIYDDATGIGLDITREDPE